MKKIIALSILTVSLVSCDSDYSPYNTNLGDGYYCCSDKEYGVDFLQYDNRKLSRADTVIYHDTLQTTRIVNLDTCNHWDVVVGMHVEEFECNDEFILVKQKPKDKFRAQDTLDWDALPYDSYERFRDHYDFHEYWIVKKQTNEVYGPLSLSHFYEYRKELNVPDELLLFSEKSPKAQVRETVFGFSIMAIVTILFYILIGLMIFLPCFGLWKNIKRIRKKRNRRPN